MYLNTLQFNTVGILPGSILCRYFRTKKYVVVVVVRIQYMINHLLIHLAQYMQYIVQKVLLYPAYYLQGRRQSPKRKNEWRFLKILSYEGICIDAETPYYLLPSLLLICHDSKLAIWLRLLIAQEETKILIQFTMKYRHKNNDSALQKQQNFVYQRLYFDSWNFVRLHICLSFQLDE